MLKPETELDLQKEGLTDGQPLAHDDRRAHRGFYNLDPDAPRLSLSGLVPEKVSGLDVVCLRSEAISKLVGFTQTPNDLRTVCSERFAISVPLCTTRPKARLATPHLDIEPISFGT